MPYAVILLAENPTEEAVGTFVSSLGDPTRYLVEAVGIEGLSNTLESAVKGGAEEIVILPLFLQLPEALDRALASALETAKFTYPEARITLAPAIGFSPGILDLLANRVEQAISSLEGRAGAPILEIGGPMVTPTAFSYLDFRKMPGQIPDVSRLRSGRSGSGVRVETLLDRVSVKPGATHAVFYAREDGFSAKVPLEHLRERGLMIYQLDGQPLPDRAGGPLRLLIPGAEDRCANIKGVSRVEIRSEPNRSGKNPSA